jgi:hypothetical protein
MKHVFYVIYVLFYTGAVFVTGLFVGQLLERSWAARRGSAQAPSHADGESLAHGVVTRQPEAATPIGKRT